VAPEGIILLVPTEEAESATVIRHVTGPPHAAGWRRELWVIVSLAVQCSRPDFYRRRSVDIERLRQFRQPLGLLPECSCPGRIESCPCCRRRSLPLKTLSCRFQSRSPSRRPTWFGQPAISIEIVRKRAPLVGGHLGAENNREKQRRELSES
jgi:hypothetical protein